MKKENTMSKNLKTEAVDHLFDAILCLKDLGKKYKIAGETFEDFPDEDQKFLHTFSFICMLSFDVYIKKC